MQSVSDSINNLQIGYILDAGQYISIDITVNLKYQFQNNNNEINHYFIIHFIHPIPAWFLNVFVMSDDDFEFLPH